MSYFKAKMHQIRFREGRRGRKGRKGKEREGRRAGREKDGKGKGCVMTFGDGRPCPIPCLYVRVVGLSIERNVGYVQNLLYTNCEISNALASERCKLFS